jgi:aspartyl protease family protein
MILKKVVLFTLIVIFIQSVFAIEKITILGLFKDKAVVTLDGKRRVLNVGKTSPEGATLISATSKEAVIEIDGIQETYTLGTHISSSFTAPSAGKKVTIGPDASGMYRVNGSINNYQVNFVVDTGATLISMNKHQAKRIGLNYKLEGKEAVSNTASGLAKVYLIKLEKVKVGDIELRDVQSAVHDGDYPDVILLGNAFLSRVNMHREGRILELEKKY